MGGGGGGNIQSHTYWYYKVYFPSHGIIRTKPIYIYDQTATLLYTLGPNDPRIDYENGIWEVPGSERNETIERISTASFWVNYSSKKLQIDYNNVLFKIDKSLIPAAAVPYAKVTADFEYATALAPIDSGRNIFDGRWDTQAQVVFYAKPPSGYAFAVLDLGQAYNIQAIDIIHGFFKPDDRRSFDINNKYTLQYSVDNINYYSVCKEATNFNLSGGASVSFERDKLGDDFSVRYFKLIINDMQKIEFEKGVWVASFVEFAAYQDVILRGNAFLVPTTAANGSILIGASSVNVDSTSGFSSSGTAYFAETKGSEDVFAYTSITSTSFLGCSGIDSSHVNDSRIAQKVETTTLLYDDLALLPKLQDKLFKVKDLNPYLDTQARVDGRAGDFLAEFLKEHTKATIDLAYSPHIRVAQTVLVIDETNNINKRYFVDSLKGTDKGISLTVAYYS